jgi:hypothetical protein
MIHLPTTETLRLLAEYLVDRARNPDARFELRERHASHKMCRATRSERRQPRHRQKTAVSSADFSDVESQRALSVAASVVARELGRQAARECFAAAMSKGKVQ